MKKVGLLLSVLVFNIVACNLVNQQARTAYTSPHSWIDAPLDGVIRPPNPCSVPGGACEIVSHSSDPMHIVQVELSVNGLVVQTTPNPDAAQTLVLTKQQWTLPGPGNYKLMVRAQNSAGIWGEYAQATITIPGASTQQPPPPPVAPPPPLVIPPATSPSSTTSSSVLPAASVTFFADATALVQGQCTTIHWQVTNVSQATLDNASINLNGTKQDCPNQTTTHTLRVLTLDGQTVQRALTINVTAPTRTFTPVPPTATRTLPPPPAPLGCSGTPVISSFSASPSSITSGGTATLSWGAVSNADSVEIDNGIGAVAAPGSRNVSPTVTTVYVLTAHCKGTSAIARTIVTVTQPVFRSLPTPTRTPIIVR